MTEKSLKVARISLPANVGASSVIPVLDAAGVGFNDISCDNWNWSSCNPSVRFRIAHAGDRIVLHFHVVEGEVRAAAGNDGERVWEDSCCEFFLSPDCNEVYYNFECNCIGTLLLHSGTVGPDRPDAPQDVYGSVLRWSSLDRALAEAARPGEYEWDLVEIIPVGALYCHSIDDLSGREMTANFYKCGDLLPHPHFLSWSPIDLPSPAFHCPQFFGRLYFG